jgi:hypothetical protein
VVTKYGVYANNKHVIKYGVKYVIKYVVESNSVIKYVFAKNNYVTNSICCLWDNVIKSYVYENKSNTELNT